MRQIQSKAYGVLNLNENQIYEFEAGILGVSDIFHYALFPMEGTPFFVLHALDEEVSFILLPVQEAVLDYSFQIPDEVTELLALNSPEDVGVMVIINIQQEELFVNLMAPVLLSPYSLRGCQYIIKDQELPVRYPLKAEGGRRNVGAET
ncbi:flagellar assembly protein FliW [Paenibacillus durus]|uniref:Flagellar assembly factor FliW n=1 Tax=Paenibacillus durus ATCC 35681 TaxID=1333534 RepID=A0A0F7FCI5_PAEDU|nr:flagellar assembly protein FliW [Paenibacillus durus]AKG36568.1 flagellar assembly protein FliW [Paenibacillus durus ATCC 35681]